MTTRRLKYGFEVTPDHNEWALVVQASAGQDGRTPLVVTLASVDGGLECVEVKPVLFDAVSAALNAAVSHLTRNWTGGQRRDVLNQRVQGAWVQLSGFGDDDPTPSDEQGKTLGCRFCNAEFETAGKVARHETEQHLDEALNEARKHELAEDAKLAKVKEWLWVLTETSKVLDGERPVAPELTDSTVTLHRTCDEAQAAAQVSLADANPHLSEVPTLVWAAEGESWCAFSSELETYFQATETEVRTVEGSTK